MANMPATSPETYSTTFDRFGGVDFTSSLTQVSAKRSPDALNMIADEKFYPVKRYGWQTISNYPAQIWGLHRFVTDEMIYLLIHAGDSLYIMGQQTAVYTGLAQAPSQGFIMNGALYLLDGQTYLQVSQTESDGVYGLSCQPVSDIAFVPTTSISRTPSGAGTPLEAVNLLSAKRINSFRADGTSKAYQLDTAPIASVDEVVVGGETQEASAYTVDTEAGTVTFSTAPASADGVDNVIVHYTATESGAADINACRIFGLFGGTNDTRVFLSGNPNRQNVDWQSGLYDPTYFPDTGYSRIGNDASAIMGYARQYDTQIIVKEGNNQDATQWLRTFQLDSNSMPVYPMEQGAVGVGAISSRTFDNLGDEPLFLSAQGVYAVSGTNVARQRSIQNRSRLIDKQLTAQTGLTNACACEHQGKYYLAINGVMYVADGAQAYTDSTGTTQYEWYYWDDIPAVCLMSDGTYLWFGTQDGRVCRFKTAASDIDLYDDDGNAYESYWTTQLTDLDTLYRTKTVRDVAYQLMPFSRGEYEIYYRSDRRPWQLMRQGSMNLLDWNDVNFNDWSFVTIRLPETARTRRKERKAEVFQVKVQNSTAGTGMGLLGLEIVYRVASRVR